VRILGCFFITNRVTDEGDSRLSGPQIKAGMSQNILSLATLFAFRYVFLFSFFILGF